MKHRVIKAKLWEKSGHQGFDVVMDGPDSRGLIARFASWFHSIGESVTIKRMDFYSRLWERSYTMKVEIGGAPTDLATAKAAFDPVNILSKRDGTLNWLNAAPNLDVSAWSLASNPTVHFLIATDDEPGIVLNATRLVTQHAGWIYIVHARTTSRKFRLEVLAIMPSGDAGRSLEHDLLRLHDTCGYSAIEVRVLEPLLRATA